MIRNIIFSVDEFYHLYSRGTDKRIIFMDHHDYQRFKALLYVCNSTNPVDIAKHFRGGRTFEELFDIEREDTLVDIGVYCLMPNHIHLLVREKTDGGITKFMHKLLTAYSMYFNKKNSRTGSLFESKFKAKHVNTDEYLKYNFAYQHLNPVKIIDPKWKENGIADRETAKRFLMEYSYSSYPDYQGVVRPESKILSRAAFPEYFTTVGDFDAFISDWLSYGGVN
ncbi:MAG: transposase [Candidatus Yonathbacteria bacterium]|nr:transposase [Candidatus Yonathbacteria bacterium]